MSLHKTRVTILGGAGMVGTALASRLAEKEYLEVVLFDRANRGIGRAIDIDEGAPLLGRVPRLRGTSDLAETEKSDIIIETTGVARHPGESREDLFLRNVDSTVGLISDALKYSPEAIVVLFTNPLDVMTQLAFEASKLPREKIFGAAIADSVRLRTFIAHALGIDASQVTAWTVGSHTEQFVPLRPYITVSGIPIKEFLSDAELDRLIEATRSEGTRLIEFTGRGAYLAPAITGEVIVDAIALDRRSVLPACVHLNGEYGIRETCLGVPTIISRKGIERILELDLDAHEISKLQKSAEDVKRTTAELTGKWTRQ